MVKEIRKGNRMLKSIWFSGLDTMQQKHNKTTAYWKYMKTFSARLKSNMRCRGRDRTVVGFITTYANNVIHHKRYEFESRSGEVYSIQHYVIKIVSNLRQFGGFLRVLQFPPPIKLTVAI